MNIHTYDKNNCMYSVYGVKLFGASIVCREELDYEDGFHYVAILSGKNLPAKPDENLHTTAYDAQFDKIAEQVLNIVGGFTDWGLHESYRGPGRRFSHAPTVCYRGSRIRVSWSGGLDI